MSKFLDSNGLAYFWGKLKAYFVAKEVGKGLSTNDFTTAEKNKLAGIEAGAEVNTVTSVNGQTGDVTVASAVMSDTVPLMDGTASAGVSDEAARGDHVHPHDISLLPLDTVTGNPIVVTDAYPTPAEGLTIALTPHQSGSGTPSPSNIRPISGYSDVELARYEKNLCPPDIEQGGFAEDGMNDNPNLATHGSRVRTPGYIPVVGGSTIVVTAAGSAAYYSISGYTADDFTTARVQSASWTALGSPIALNSNVKYIRIVFRKSNTNTAITPSEISNVMCEFGNTATTYEPYISPVTVNVHVGGLGKNLCPVDRDSRTGYFWGTRQDDIKNAINGLPAGTYTITLKYKILELPSGGVGYGVYATKSSGTLIGYSVTTDNSPTLGKVYTITKTFTLAEADVGTVTNFYLYCDNATTHSGTTGRGSYSAYNIQIEEGSTATTYEPYFVIGGEYDVLEGELKVTYGYIASYNGESLPSKWISDRDVYAAGTTPTTGAEVAYELATPTVYTFTPQPFDMLDGTNTFITNTDSLTISYRCYIQKYIQKLIAALA